MNSIAACSVEYNMYNMHSDYVKQLYRTIIQGKSTGCYLDNLEKLRK